MMINDILIALCLGIGAGIIDIIPMIIKKMDRYSIMSAFLHWLAVGIIISYSNVFNLSGWLNGAVISVLSAIPIAILVMKDDKKSVAIILFMSIVLGSLVGFVHSMI